MPGPGPEPTGHLDAAFGLALAGGRVLLVSNPRRVGGRSRLLWDLPGGRLAPGETLAAGLRREWREETGLEGTVADLLWVAEGRKARPDGAVVYTWRATCFAVATTGVPRPGPGIQEACWVETQEARRRLSAPYHGPAREWLAGGRRRHHEVVWVDPLDPAEGAGEAGDAAGPRELMALAAAAAAGEDAGIAAGVDRALARGESPARVVEALLEVVPFAGFPRAIHALRIARTALGPAVAVAEAPPEAFPGLGAATFAKVYGANATAVRAGLERLDPRLARWTLDFAYGRVLAAEGRLSLVEREWLAVAILERLGNLTEPLLGHRRALAALLESARTEPGTGASFE